jgi:hypothetical protein
MELGLKKGRLEFLIAGFFLGILFTLSIMLNWYGEPANLEAILLLLILFVLFFSFFVLGNRDAKVERQLCQLSINF